MGTEGWGRGTRGRGYIQIADSPWCIAETMGFPGGSVVKNLPADAVDARERSSIPGLETSPGRRNGNLLQHSCLENSMHRGTWQVWSMGLQRVRHDLVTEHTHTQRTETNTAL